MGSHVPHMSGKQQICWSFGVPSAPYVGECTVHFTAWSPARMDAGKGIGAYAVSARSCSRIGISLSREQDPYHLERALVGVSVPDPALLGAG